MEERQETLIEIEVPPGQTPGVRLDVYITEKSANATRAKVQRGIREGRVTVNGRLETRPSYGIQPGDHLVCRVLRAPPIEVQPSAPLVRLCPLSWKAATVTSPAAPGLMSML